MRRLWNFCVAMFLMMASLAQAELLRGGTKPIKPQQEHRQAKKMMMMMMMGMMTMDETTQTTPTTTTTSTTTTTATTTTTSTTTSSVACRPATEELPRFEIYEPRGSIEEGFDCECNADGSVCTSHEFPSLNSRPSGSEYPKLLPMTQDMILPLGPPTDLLPPLCPEGRCFLRLTSDTEQFLATSAYGLAHAWYPYRYYEEDIYVLNIRYRISGNNVNGIAADGMTFVMHRDPRGGEAVGYAGGALGVYSGEHNRSDPSLMIKPAIVIELDTYYNQWFKDSSARHVHITAVHGNGTIEELAEAEETEEWKVRTDELGTSYLSFIYRDHVLSVYMASGDESFWKHRVAAVPLDLDKFFFPHGGWANYSGQNRQVYMGFTSATAHGSDNHDIIGYHNFVD